MQDNHAPVATAQRQQCLEDSGRLMIKPVDTAPEAQLYAGSAAVYLDDFKDAGTALRYFHKALACGYREDVCLEGIARCHLLLGDHGQAYSYYRRYIDSGYFSVSMSINYAFLLVERNEYDAALGCLERAQSTSASEDVRGQLQKYIDYTRRIIRDGHLPRDPDRVFVNFVTRSLPLLRNLKRPGLLPLGTAGAAGCAVIVELRKHPWLEHCLRNVAHFLPESWSMLVVHGSVNERFVHDILDAWRMSGVIAMHNLGVGNLSREQYSTLMKRADFWGLLPAERTLMFQTDAMLLRRGLEEFYQWDYIGAPWNDFHVPEGVGNGGLSLRTVQVMKELASRYGAASPVTEMEDVFYARMLHLHGGDLTPCARLANREVAHAFCAEWRLRDLPAATKPLGLHQAWRFHSARQVEAWFAMAESGY